jgi:HSP20 family protein
VQGGLCGLDLSRIKDRSAGLWQIESVFKPEDEKMVEKTEQAGLWPSLYDPFRTLGTRLSEWLSPATEASGGADAYDIAMELPGVAEDDIDLSVEDGVLTIRGEKKTQTEKSGDTWFFSERQYGAFRRSFRLPPDAEGAKASAHMADGVLRVSVPKLKQEDNAMTHKISIKRG